MKNKALVILIFITSVLKSQLDTMKSGYSKLEVKKYYSVSLHTEKGEAGEIIYKADGKVVTKEVYDKFQNSVENFKNCKPCILETYTAQEVLQNRAIKYQDCPVGYWVNFYPSGKIKTIGYYRENESDVWSPLWDAGYCMKHGWWTDYDEKGKVIKKERYEYGNLKD